MKGAELGRDWQMNFEVVWCQIVRRGMSAFGIAMGDAVTDFELGFFQAGVAPATRHQAIRL